MSAEVNKVAEARTEQGPTVRGNEEDENTPKPPMRVEREVKETTHKRHQPAFLH